MLSYKQGVGGSNPSAPTRLNIVYNIGFTISAGNIILLRYLKKVSLDTSLDYRDWSEDSDLPVADFNAGVSSINKSECTNWM